MKQLAQQLRDGSMHVLDVAMPALNSGSILVKNHFSLISAGTEGGTVTAARKSLVGKAKDRPEQVKQVLDTLRQQGVVQTYRAVSKKLDSYSPLGYSAAGEIIEVSTDVKGFSVGDLVACAGAGYASHAEIVSVPANLSVALPANANLERACYNTLGAIALQGVRQADIRLGETAVVMGLGLLGHLTCLILKASGVKVIGLDISESAVRSAKNHCTDSAYLITDDSLPDIVAQKTNGIMADAVIITAATDSLQPINLAGRLLRKRGSVVVVGDVPTGFDREPDYYKKELIVKMSCSYGPGRYDLNYEQKGVDYPPGYVRWTENRNMQAFQSLIHEGAINLDYLTTHRFSIDESPSAYDLIVNKSENYLGIVIEYETQKDHERRPLYISDSRISAATPTVQIGFLGAGSYAMSHLLPNFPSDYVSLRGVMTSSGTSSRSVAEKYGFNYVASTPEDIINETNTDTVFVASRHDSHAEYVTKSLKAGKNVFVEKPLCLTREQLGNIIAAYSDSKARLMVGFNRRFAPLSIIAKEFFDQGPMSMIYRVNSGAIPSNSWIQDDELGGGRIIGEVCHFIDFLIFMNGSLPMQVHAHGMTDPEELNDTVTLSLSFENGSIGSISYFANGPKQMPKEYIEIYRGGCAARITDFKELEIIGTRKTIRKKRISQDKGQGTMVRSFLDALRNGRESPIPMRELVATTAASFSAVESLSSGQSIKQNISAYDSD